MWFVKMCIRRNEMKERQIYLNENNLSDQNKNSARKQNNSANFMEM